MTPEWGVCLCPCAPCPACCPACFFLSSMRECEPYCMTGFLGGGCDYNTGWLKAIRATSLYFPSVEAPICTPKGLKGSPFNLISCKKNHMGELHFRKWLIKNLLVEALGLEMQMNHSWPVYSRPEWTINLPQPLGLNPAAVPWGFHFHLFYCGCASMDEREHQREY